MSRLLMVATILFHLVVPLALAGWVFFAPPANRIHLLSKILLVGSYVGLLWTGGSGWQVVGTVFRPIAAGVTGVAILLSLLWLPDLQWWSEPLWPTGAAVALWGLLGGFFATSWYGVAEGLEPPDVETVDLAFPLDDGDFFIGWGGSSPATNRHMKVLDGDEQYRGQAHAHDIVELNAIGARADGLLPSDPAAYEIFGARVVAPCAGRVVRAVDDRPDLDPPTRSDGPPAGNHVLLSCGDFQVALAHLKRDSLEVEAGQTVETGDPIGRVGNSGNTTEPHLHVHAQRPAEGDEWMAAEPLAITFEGEFFAKGRVVSR